MNNIKALPGFFRGSRQLGQTLVLLLKKTHQKVLTLLCAIGRPLSPCLQV